MNLEHTNIAYWFNYDEFIWISASKNHFILGSRKGLKAWTFCHLFSCANSRQGKPILPGRQMHSKNRPSWNTGAQMIVMTMRVALSLRCRWQIDTILCTHINDLLYLLPSTALTYTLQTTVWLSGYCSAKASKLVLHCLSFCLLGLRGFNIWTKDDSDCFGVL